MTKQSDIRVIVLGTGQMGSGICRLLVEKKGLTLAGVFARRSQRQGLDLSQVIHLNKNPGIFIQTDLHELIKSSRPHIAIQATCSELEDAKSEIHELLQSGVNVISIAEQMAFPDCHNQSTVRQMQEMANINGVSVLGTGVNPGFVLDLLVITLSAVCSEIYSITAQRSNDLSPYGPSVLNAQGIGLTPQAFKRGIQSGAIKGHYGFRESMYLIAKAIGWNIERIEEKREPIISKVVRQTSFVKIEAGQVAGCNHTAVAYCDNKPMIRLMHPQQIQPQLENINTGDSIIIEGVPKVHLSGSPEIPGGLATMALAINMIPRVLNATPGLHTILELPVPAAMLGGIQSV